MKKTFNYMLLLCYSIFALTCCSKENQEIERPTGNYSIKVLIETIQPNRTAINNEKQMVWSINDQIGVYGNLGTFNAPFMYDPTTKDEDGYATFRGDLKDDENPQLIYFPYEEEVVWDGNRLELTLPNTYEYTSQCLAPMIGVKQDDGNYLLKHLCGLLKLAVCNMPTDVNKLVISSETPIAGQAYVENDIQTEETRLILDNDKGHNQITVNFSSDTVQNYTFYIPIPANEYSSLKFIFYLEDGTPYVTDSVKECRIQRAAMMDLGDPTIKDKASQLITDIDGYDGMLLGNENTLWMYRINQQNNTPQKMYAAMPSVNNTEVIENSIVFNPQGLPDKISTTDFSLKILNYEENSFDVYLLTDSVTYCIRDVQTEEPLKTVKTKGIIEEREKLERSKKALNTVRVIVKAVKLAHDMWQTTSGFLPNNIKEISFKNNFNLHTFDQIKKDFEEYYHSFDNFVSNNIEDSELQYTQETQFNQTAQNTVDWLSTQVSIFKLLTEQKDFSLFLDALEGHLDKMEGLLYEQEKNLLEWEKLIKNNLKVVTEETDIVDYTSATLNGRIEGLYQMEGKCGFIYSDGKSNNIQTARVSKVISAKVSGLKPNTTYTYSAYYTSEQLQFMIKGEEKSFTTQNMKVITGNVTEQTAHTATIYGKEEGGWEAHKIIYNLGICYSSTNRTPEFEKDAKCFASSEEDGNFSVQLTDLNPNTKYFYRAFMIVDNYPIYYGETSYFFTKDEITTGQMVDLGLSVKWAGWNVGASRPEEYGGYYAWGELHEKSDYSYETYQYYDQENWEYINNISGTQYDVARVKWGGSWRMPTLAECKELIDKCTWTWTTYNGVKGQKVTGPNGNSIFLPAAGSRRGTSVGSRGSSGYYWSGTLNEGISLFAYFLSFTRGGVRWSYGARDGGRSVRPVSE